MESRENFIDALSLNRFNSYEMLCPNGSLPDLIGAYHWNLLVCSNMYPFIQSVEVALRNSLHNALTQKFESDSWFDIMALDPKTLGIVNKTRNDLMKMKKPANSSDIVAALTFGFWLALLQNKYYSNQENLDKLWPELIPMVFPYYKRGQSEQKNISKRFREIKNLRNRLFHHEPIWKFKNIGTAEKSISELRKKFNEIIKAIGWISKEKKIYLREFGFVDEFKKNCDIQKLDAERNKINFQ